MSSAAKQRIIETASDLFYRQGYNATGINQIIEEAAVAKATMYQHFESKEDLLYEYLASTASATNVALYRAQESHKTVRQKVAALFDFLQDFAAQTSCNGCNFLNISAEIPAGNSRIRGVLTRQKDEVRTLFTNILRSEGKEKLADEIYLIFDGAMAVCKLYNDAWPVEVAKKASLKLL